MSSSQTPNRSLLLAFEDDDGAMGALHEYSNRLEQSLIEAGSEFLIYDPDNKTQTLDDFHDMVGADDFREDHVKNPPEKLAGAAVAYDKAYDKAHEPLPKCSIFYDRGMVPVSKLFCMTQCTQCGFGGFGEFGGENFMLCKEPSHQDTIFGWREPGMKDMYLQRFVVQVIAPGGGGKTRALFKRAKDAKDFLRGNGPKIECVIIQGATYREAVRFMKTQVPAC
jgi:hypothetical protein